MENLDKQHFIDLFKAAMQDIYPQIKEKYQEESIYGITFEIANTVCLVYAEDFGTNIYLNTEERYQEAIEDCDKEEKGYYRFSAWAEWIPESADTELFKELQEYLQANCPTDDEDEDEGEDEISAEELEETCREMDTVSCRFLKRIERIGERSKLSLQQVNG